MPCRHPHRCRGAYAHGSTIATSSLPFEDWSSVLGSERLTGALLDRLIHHVSSLAMNGDSYRLKQSTGRRRAIAAAEQNQATADKADPETGEITPDQPWQRDMAGAPIGTPAISA